MNTANESFQRRAAVAVIVIAVFLVAAFLVGRVLAMLAPALVGYQRWVVMSTLEALICVAAVMVIARTGFIGALREMRLARPVHVAFVFMFLVTLPMPIAFALSGPLSQDIDPLRLLLFSGAAPLLEEIVYRGFAFWMLYRYARLGFWPAALLPAVLFGVAHLYQGNDATSALGIFAITAIGGVWFSWLLLRWDNLWVPAAAHMFMNAWWEVFAVDDTALGGWMPTAVRGLVIVLSIAGTIYWTRKPLMGKVHPTPRGSQA